MEPKDPTEFFILQSLLVGEQIHLFKTGQIAEYFSWQQAEDGIDLAAGHSSWF